MGDFLKNIIRILHINSFAALEIIREHMQQKMVKSYHTKADRANSIWSIVYQPWYNNVLLQRLACLSMFE